MSVAADTVEAVQGVRFGPAELGIDFPEPFFFVLKAPGKTFTDQELYEFDAANEGWRIETNAEGDFEIMPPPFTDTSRKNFELDFQLASWAKQDGTGVCFESSAKFTFANGAKRMPDASWILKERYFALPEVERSERFTAIAPDFVLELRSKSDRIRNLTAKLHEYIENGVRLGWLIDPEENKVYIYRSDGSVEILEKPAKVSGENVLRDFELDLTEIW